MGKHIATLPQTGVRVKLTLDHSEDARSEDSENDDPRGYTWTSKKDAVENWDMTAGLLCRGGGDVCTRAHVQTVHSVWSLGLFIVGSGPRRR